jgi:two-component system, NarL family, invasion response regulator UvrY
MYRVLLVDDHAVVRAGVRAILEDRFGTLAVTETGSGDGALSALAAPFDIVILDLSMPGRSGIDLLAEIKHRHPELPVLIVSLHAEEQFAVRALRAGAAGYVMKSSASEHLVTAFERVVRGGRYVSEALAERLAVQVGGGSTTPHERLSDREFEVMRGIASGEAVGEIASRMNLSVKTISTYRARLLEKMGMATNAELVRYAIQNGLV